MSTAHPGFDGPAALVPGELRGYRRFRLADGGLHPTVHTAGGPWGGRLEHAVCAAYGDHPAPDRECGCGLYGWYHPSHATGLSGFGNVTAVVAARGRTVLGDHGFRAACARVEAVALPAHLHLAPRSARRARRALRARYPRAAVYRSRRRMLRDHPPPDLRELGITARPSTAGRNARLALGLWALGVAAFSSAALLPPGAASRAGPAGWLGAIAAFLLWQALLVRLTAAGPAAPPGPGRRH